MFEYWSLRFDYYFYMSKAIYKIVGMDCPNCAAMLECDLEDAGCKSKCSYAKSILEVDEPHDPKKIVEIIKKSGYSVLPD